MQQPVTLSSPEGESYFMRHLAPAGSGNGKVVPKVYRSTPFTRMGQGAKCKLASKAARRDIRGALCGTKVRGE